MRKRVPPRSAVWRFALRALAWLAPCFAAWYWTAAWLARPAAWLARAAIWLADGGIVNGLEWEEGIARFVTNIEMSASPAQAAVLLVEVNPLLYTYGIAIVAALMLASRASWRKLLLGVALLLPFQAWGIAFDVLAQIVRAGPQAASQVSLVGWKAEGVALGYQLGSLIFPTLAPVLLWAGMGRSFIEGLVRK